MADKENGFLLIPRGILQDKRLNLAQRMVFAYVSSFENGYGCCIQSNDGISEKINIPPYTISRAISYLSQIGYVDVDNPMGRNRRITPQPSQIGQDEPQQIRKDEISNLNNNARNLNNNARYPQQNATLPQQIRKQSIQLEDIEKTKEHIVCVFKKKFPTEEMTTERTKILLNTLLLAREKDVSDVETLLRQTMDGSASAKDWFGGMVVSLERHSKL